MLPPYGTDEIARAVLARLESRVRVQAVTVRANDVDHTWCITARLDDGREIVAEYAYTARDGIHTPAELANWFAREVATS